MRKAALKAAKTRLEGMKKALLREITDDLRQGREGAKEDGMDTYDLASEERDREINFILGDREREKLQSIESALDRIEDGSYGICENCESEIAPGRLDAMPFSRLCVSCQAEQEKEARSQRRFDDERAYRRLATTEVDEDSA
jgi:DnaK suppressor protein